MLRNSILTEPRNLKALYAVYHMINVNTALTKLTKVAMGRNAFGAMNHSSYSNPTCMLDLRSWFEHHLDKCAVSVLTKQLRLLSICCPRSVRLTPLSAVSVEIGLYGYTPFSQAE